MCQNRCLTSRIPSCPPAHHDAHKVAQLYHWDKIFIASWYSDVVDSQVKRFLVPNDRNLTSAPDSWTEVKDACRGRNTTRNSHIDTEGCCTIGCRTEGCYLSPRWPGGTVIFFPLRYALKPASQTIGNFRIPAFSAELTSRSHSRRRLVLALRFHTLRPTGELASGSSASSPLL